MTYSWRIPCLPGESVRWTKIKQILFDDVTARQMLLDAREREIWKTTWLVTFHGTFAKLLYAA